MDRIFDPSAFHGLFGRDIPFSLVNFPYEDVDTGDMIRSSCGNVLLRHSKRGYRLVTNNPYRYLLEEDLQQQFEKV